MRKEAQTDEVSAKQAELEGRVAEISSDIALLDECLQIVAAAQGSGADSEAAIEQAKEKLTARLDELNQEEAVLEDCLELLEEQISQGVSGGLPATRGGIEARLAIVNQHHASLSRCIELLAQSSGS